MEIDSHDSMNERFFYSQILIYTHLKKQASLSKRVETVSYMNLSAKKFLFFVLILYITLFCITKF